MVSHGCYSFEIKCLKRIAPIFNKESWCGRKIIKTEGG